MMRKPIVPGQSGIVLDKENGAKCTSVGQKVGGNDPATLVEPVESIRDAD